MLQVFHRLRRGAAEEKARLLTLLVVAGAVLATGCAQVPREPLVHQPMTAFE